MSKSSLTSNDTPKKQLNPTIPFGPNVVFTRSAIAMAPTKEACGNTKRTPTECQYPFSIHTSSTGNTFSVRKRKTHHSGAFPFLLARFIFENPLDLQRSPKEATKKKNTRINSHTKRRTDPESSSEAPTYRHSKPSSEPKRGTCSGAT